jgi:Trk-type K+ transport system membrane component
MRRLRQPDLWFLVTLLAVVIVGAALLAQSGAVRAETRRLSYFRHYWQAAFDASSAACGVGLLTYGFEGDYTPRGRWILTALGVAGATLFLAAVAHAIRRIQAGDAQVRVPHPLLAVGAFIIVQGVVLGVTLLARQLGQGEATTSETAWNAIAAFSSLGWAGGTRQGLEAWPLALLAWLGALGWPIWLLLVPPLSRRYVRWRAALAMFGTHAVILLLAALLISAFETPRGTIGRGAPSDTLSGQPWQTRYARSLVQTVAACGAGMPTEALEESDVTAGTKVTLSAVLLVGGLGGSATGGVQWPLLLWALAGGAAALGRLGRPHPAPDFARWMHAGLACLVLLALLALLVALGLLLIENWTASRFQPPPTFADALLDACSVVAGGNLSSGLTETVTSRNLVSGIRQSANLYQYGMIWLTLAMLAGRMLPLVILRRLATAQR